MSLITVHKILISTAIAFFLFYGLWELDGARSGGGAGAVVRGVMALAAAVGFALYLRTVKPLKGDEKLGKGR
jgi:hypothetical protein